MPDVLGKVAGLSNHYRDGVERQEIHIPSAQAAGLPHIHERRVPVDLVVGRSTYQAGVRSKRGYPVVWVCPDLRDADGRKHRLADVLRGAGLRKNQAVKLTVDGRRVRVGAR